MTLNSDERELLRRISEGSGPVEPPDYFHSIYPPDFPVSAAEDDPRREAWVELQLNLCRAYMQLYRRGLVEVVHPADGVRGDMVVITDAGRAALV
ncbi:hypothetical protein OHA46_33400 (plasmid) [Streptomyces sp. NBC_00708]